MRKQKLLAVVLSAAMVLSLAACGSGEGGASVTATPTPGGDNPPVTATPTPVAEVSAPKEVSINFEDGNFSFTKVYTKPANADAATNVTVADFNGSKALQVAKTDKNKVPYVAFDLSSLLGANISKLATVEMTMGVSYADGSFSAVSGEIEAWIGEALEKNAAGWSVYLAKKNPYVATYTLPEDKAFTADNNIIVVQMKEDTGAAEHGNATLYIDDIRFLDAAGNLLTADSSVAFATPEGFENTGHDINLCYVDNEVALEGFAVSAGGWSQAGIDLTDEQRALIVPGSVITVNYKCDEPVWLLAIGENPLGGWLRGVNQDTFVVDGYVASDNSCVQYTYEQLAAYFGDGFEQYLTTLQCEGKADWEVFSVTVGTKSNFATLGSKTALEGFAVSAGGWAQAGIDLTDEQRALLVPGCVVEVNYKCDEPVWLLAIGENPLGGWLRGVNQDDFIVDGAVSADGTTVQYTYEQLAAYFGDGFEQYLTTLQCEGKADWEVYSISVGKPIYPAHNVVTVEGLTASAGGWAQAGIDLTDEQRALFAPGCVVTINYKCDEPVWFVAVGENPLGGWLRAVNQDTFVVDGAAAEDGSFVQYTYEQLATYLGEDFGQYLATLQCEGKADWEVYSVTVGQR